MVGLKTSAACRVCQNVRRTISHLYITQLLAGTAYASSYCCYVGPCVGKSTIVNRLAGDQGALYMMMNQVTRDHPMSQLWRDHEFGRRYRLSI